MECYSVISVDSAIIKKCDDLSCRIHKTYVDVVFLSNFIVIAFFHDHSKVLNILSANKN